MGRGRKKQKLTKEDSGSNDSAATELADELAALEEQKEQTLAEVQEEANKAAAEEEQQVEQPPPLEVVEELKAAQEVPLQEDIVEIIGDDLLKVLRDRAVGPALKQRAKILVLAIIYNCPQSSDPQRWFSYGLTACAIDTLNEGKAKAILGGDWGGGKEVKLEIMFEYVKQGGYAASRNYIGYRVEGPGLETEDEPENEHFVWELLHFKQDNEAVLREVLNELGVKLTIRSSKRKEV